MKKKFEFSFDVSALANYVKDNSEPLLQTALFGSKTQDLIYQEGNVISGIKSSERLPILETDVVFQTGGTCAFNASGTTTITQRSLTVGKIKVEEELCPKTLETKFTQMWLQKGSKYENLPNALEEAYTTRKAKKIANALEVALWQGDTGSGTANLNKFDGLLKLIDAGSPTSITPAGVITTANAISIIDSVWGGFPTGVDEKDDLRIFAGWDVYKDYLLALRAANLYHYAVETSNGEIQIPGTPYKITAVHGLDNTNRVIGVSMDNLYLGTDMEHEEEEFDIWYSKDDKTIKVSVEFKLGVQVGFVEEVVEYSPA